MRRLRDREVKWFSQGHTAYWIVELRFKLRWYGVRVHVPTSISTQTIILGISLWFTPDQFTSSLSEVQTVQPPKMPWIHLCITVAITQPFAKTFIILPWRFLILLLSFPPPSVQHPQPFFPKKSDLSLNVCLFVCFFWEAYLDSNKWTNPPNYSFSHHPTHSFMVNFIIDNYKCVFIFTHPLKTRALLYFPLSL